MKNLMVLLILLLPKLAYNQIYINEVMALNTSTIVDNTGNYNDWIEIYNAGPSDVDLANYFISDLGTNLTKFHLTSVPNQLVVPSQDFLLIWASGNTSSGYNHTDFSLSSTNGEAVYLTMPDGVTLVSSLVFPPQRENVSYGRLTDGANTIKFFYPSSPNNSNNTATSYDGFLSPPSFSRQGGFFSTDFSLTLSHPENDVNIIYTTDGSIPVSTNLSGTSYNYKNSYPENPGDPFGGFLSRSFSSLNYSLPILIQDKTSQSNQISTISSTWHKTPTYIPNYQIKKGTVIRAIASKTGYLPSNVVTNTYIFSSSGTNPFSFPVVSVAVQENHLFEYNQGIYTAGVTFDNYRLANPNVPIDVCSPGNFTNDGSAWERPANVELVENQQNVLNQALSVRIHGSCSPSFPYKSLRLYGANQFDSYPFFPEYPQLFHDRIILRNSGNDYNQTMFKDVFVQAWMKHLNFASQKSRQSIVFLNGEYWGIHNIRERIDNYFLNALYGVDKDNLDMRSVSWTGPDEIEEGDAVHYDIMYSFITGNDMSNFTNYNTVKEMLDPESLIDYEIVEIFIGNIDWPQNNVRLWRTRTSYTPNAPFGKDGRWRWILYDTDRSLGEVVNYQNLDLQNQTNHPDNILFKKLLDNLEFRNLFINRYADLLNSSLKSSYSLPIFNNLKNIYAPEILEHITRWKNLADLNAWEAQCSIVSNYITGRPNEMYSQIKDFFDIDGEYNLTVSTPDTAKGFVKVNMMNIKSSTKGLPENIQSWTGIYFDDIPLEIKAMPKIGYKFAYWIHNGVQNSNETILINTNTDVSYEAFFEPLILSDHPIPEIAAEIANCGYKLYSWSANNLAGSSPSNSKFVYLDQENPTITANIEGFTSGVFNLTSATRINGLEDLGFSFINTGSGNEGYPGSKLGGFLLAINTENLDTVKVSWMGRTITPNPRKYKIRLYFREGDIQAFQEFNPIIEYTGSTFANDSVLFKNILIPSEIMNKPYVQLFWKYYYTGTATSGARDQLAIDNINVQGTKVYSGTINASNTLNITPNYIQNSGKIFSGNQVSNNSKDGIMLNPGFEAKAGSVFKAEIKTCN
ncbi:spore coat protein CotH [Lacihabitans sp. LS3-19]|uniref:CotH kinase family protein n=1 Tax=Lacihabitans sp. LS3-19 TaxID=2487335 RepID=UPI0020CEFDDB|nr:CotH kinase family protein [Lacihabitans sp. LS3-19]MCP9766887.1 spore coat protein CotH [Lacihabitans sp. LS3-19]